jgi:hypothetical protein
VCRVSGRKPASVERMELIGDGVEDQAAEEAVWCMSLIGIGARRPALCFQHGAGEADAHWRS